MSSQRWTTRVTVKPSPKIRAAMAMAESEIVTSPTLKPKKAARSEDKRSADSMPQGASASIAGDQDQQDARDAGGEHADLRQRAPAQAGVGLQRRRNPGLLAQGPADELVDEHDGEQQQRQQDADPDELIDQERREGDVADEHAARSPRRRRSSRRSGAARPGLSFGRDVGAETRSSSLGRGGEAAQQLGERERGGERKDAAGQRP